MRPLTERLSPVIKALVIGYSLVFALLLFVPQARLFAETHLALGPSVLHGELWQLVTALLIHVSPMGFLFDLIGLWFVGATVEHIVGVRRFFVLFFAPAVLANVAMAGVGMLVAPHLIYSQGCSMGVLALFVGFGKYYGKTPTRVLGGLVLEARVFTAILIGFSVLTDLMRLALPSLAADVAAIVLAYALSPGTAGGLFSGMFSGLSRKRGRHKLEVLDGGRRKDKPSFLN